MTRAGAAGLTVAAPDPVGHATAHHRKDMSVEPREPNDPDTEAPVSGRLRRRGLQVAFTVPAVLAALHVGVAAADDTPTHPHPAHPGHPDPHPHSSVSVPLSRVGDAGADFTGGGSDPLDRGQVQLHEPNHDGTTDVSVELRGTGQTSAGGYQVVFRRYSDKNAETIGTTFSTNSHGDFHGRVGTLSGHHRVGVIVVQHNGTDQYVASLNL
jgi:hypothetical protein